MTLPNSFCSPDVAGTLIKLTVEAIDRPAIKNFLFFFLSHGWLAEGPSVTVLSGHQWVWNVVTRIARLTLASLPPGKTHGSVSDRRYCGDVRAQESFPVRSNTFADLHPRG